jgi:hypothetical protein
MPRLIKKTVILAKVEATAGTDATPAGATDAIQVSNMSITPVDAKMANINTVTPWFGGAFDLTSTSSVKISFDVLMGGSGTAATAPAWGQLLLGTAMAEVTGLLTPNRVEYNPITDSLKTLSIYYYDDGVLHKALGCMGNVKLSAKSGEAPKFTFDFVGVDGIPTAAANATAVLSAWKTPPVITKANVVDITFGCTYATGALSGGTAYNSSGLTLDWGNTVAFSPLLSTETVVLSDRAVKGAMELDLSAAQEVTQIAAVKANTLTSLGFTIGTATGNKIILFAPAVQLMNPRKAEFNGQRLIGFDMHLRPSAGNDEIKLVSL